MMGRSPRCYIPSFVGFGQPVTVKKIFEGFLPYLGMAAILVIIIIIIIKTLFKEEAQLDLHPIFPGVLI